MERSRPETVWSVVVLPAPLAPISVTISPWLTWKEMSLMAWMAPYQTLMPSTFSSVSIGHASFRLPR